MADRLVAMVAAAALIAGAAATTATAAPAGAAKPADPPAAGQGAFAMERTAGSPTLLVTFADSPRRDAAGSRLGDLGKVAPVVPEAGIWSLVPDDPATARAAALRRPEVEGAEWSLARSSDDRPAPPAAPGPAPVFTDPLFTPPSQWGLLAGPAWGADLTTVGPRPRIAILDSGIDPTHEEWGGPASPLVAPRSTLRGDADASDHGDSGHGTHVAGIAAAPANGVGIVGVAPASPTDGQVIPVQIADNEGASTDETMIKGIRHAVNNGAKVINISAGGPGYSRAFQDTILFATRKGALVVASVGNQGQDVNALNFPAGYSRVLGVGAQCDGTVTFDCPQPFATATFSNHNRTVDVVAPGVNVLSSVPVRVTERAVQPGYALKDGTSMAAPYVTGVAALVMAANGNRLSPYQVERQITNTAIDLGKTGRDDVNGYGLVNPRAAVTLRAPVDDTAEVNDDIKWVKGSQTALDARGRGMFTATADRWEDPEDVYPLGLRQGDRVAITLTHRTGVLDLYLWEPGTPTVGTQEGNLERHLLRYRSGARKKVVINYTAQKTGVHFIDVFARRGGDAYTLRIARKR